MKRVIRDLKAQQSQVDTSSVHDEVLLPAFQQTDSELGNLIAEARAAGFNWSSILDVIMPILREEAGKLLIEALKKLLGKVSEPIGPTLPQHSKKPKHAHD